MENDFLIQEFREHRREVNEKLEKIYEEQKKTTIQTTRTNGRVDSLKVFQESAEEDIQNLKAITSETKGRDKMIGVAMGVVITIGTAILVWLFTDHLIK